jgi:hypothetical protein
MHAQWDFTSSVSDDYYERIVSNTLALNNKKIAAALNQKVSAGVVAGTVKNRMKMPTNNPNSLQTMNVLLHFRNRTFMN